MNNSRHSLPISIALFLFSATLAIGLLVAQNLATLTPKFQPTPIADFGPSDIVVFVITAVILITLVLRFRNFSGRLFNVVLLIFIFSGTALTLGTAAPNLNSTLLMLIAGIIALSWLVMKRVWNHDLVLCLALAGIGGYISQSFTPITAVVVLLVLSFYDIIAVYRTRHMVAFAETMIRARAIFGFVIPTELKGFRESLAAVVVGGKHMVLGSGDVLLPLLLAGSLVRVSTAAAWIVVGASVLGLVLVYILFTRQTVRRPMAALPPIAMMAILGYLLSALINL